MIFRTRIVMLLACSGLVLLSGMACKPGSPTASWQRPQAPRQFTLPPRLQPMREYGEFAAGPAAGAGAAATDWRRPARPLPPLGSAGQPNPQLGIHPIELTVAADGSPAPGLPGGLDPDGMMPMQQLILGGEGGEDDGAGSYCFQARDRLEIHVAEHPEFSGEAEVPLDGAVRIPNTDDYVEVKGRNRRQVAKAVGDAIAPYIRGEPKVRINIRFGNGGYYHVFGEVRNQGRFALGVAPVRLSEAVFRANSARMAGFNLDESKQDRLAEETVVASREGFSAPRYANFSQVSLITPHRTHPSRRVYNVKSALIQGVGGDDPVIMPGQIIFVPSTGDERIMEFFRRAVAPIRVVGHSEAETGYWIDSIKGEGHPGIYHHRRGTRAGGSCANR